MRATVCVVRCGIQFEMLKSALKQKLKKTKKQKKYLRENILRVFHVRLYIIKWGKSSSFTGEMKWCSLSWIQEHEKKTMRKLNWCNELKWKKNALSRKKKQPWCVPKLAVYNVRCALLRSAVEWVCAWLLWLHKRYYIWRSLMLYKGFSLFQCGKVSTEASTINKSMNSIFEFGSSASVADVFHFLFSAFNCNLCDFNHHHNIRKT